MHLEQQRQLRRNRPGFVQYLCGGGSVPLYLCQASERILEDNQNSNHLMATPSTSAAFQLEKGRNSVPFQQGAPGDQE